MSIFGKIMGAIFGTKADAAPGATPTAGGSAPTVSTPGSSSAVPPAASVDVAPILDKAVAAKQEKLEWRTSIVDLMKALDIRLQSEHAQGACEGAQLYRPYQRLRRYEHLASQTGHCEDRCEWRQGSCRLEALEGHGAR